MRIRKFILGMAVLALLPVSCSKQQGESLDGRVSFSLDADGQVTEAVRSNVADYATLPQPSKFTIVLTNAGGNEVYRGLLEGYDASTALKAGEYSVSASYGSTSDEGFGKPCFTGSKTFSVAGGSTTSVTIPVSLANSIIKVECGDSFKSYYTDYSFTVKTGAGAVINFPKGETRAAFVDAYTISVSGTLTNQGGKTQSFSKDYKSLSPKTCYTLRFDVSNVGSGSISISFDDSAEDVNLTDVDLND